MPLFSAMSPSEQFFFLEGIPYPNKYDNKLLEVNNNNNNQLNGVDFFKMDDFVKWMQM